MFNKFSQSSVLMDVGALLRHLENPNLLKRDITTSLSVYTHANPSDELEATVTGLHSEVAPSARQILDTRDVSTDALGLVDANSHGSADLIVQLLRQRIHELETDRGWLTGENRLLVEAAVRGCQASQSKSSLQDFVACSPAVSLMSLTTEKATPSQFIHSTLRASARSDGRQA
ncbi:unnamed protein product [Protopolystoma xenopodis]|uniref:Uncharacterized protein n=1 Tax=Protopolystoma xenopodis TaxID=117903 RepID=A0A448X8E3_9PLAT|nr:unnamed protein product [Protopolystoma xenopodis]